MDGDDEDVAAAADVDVLTIDSSDMLGPLRLNGLEHSSLLTHYAIHLKLIQPLVITYVIPPR